MTGEKSGEKRAPARAMSKAEAARLKGFLKRVTNLDQEAHEIRESIKLVYAEARDAGFNVKVMRAIGKEMRQDARDRADYEMTLDRYRDACELQRVFDFKAGVPIEDPEPGEADEKAAATSDAKPAKPRRKSEAAPAGPLAKGRQPADKAPRAKPGAKPGGDDAAAAPA